MSPGSLALIRPRSTVQDFEYSEPLSIEAIAAFALHEGVEKVNIFDRRIKPNLWKTLKEDDPYDCIGITMMTSEDLVDTMRLLVRLHDRYPQTELVVGGLFVLTNYERARRVLPDYVTCFAGEGEGWLSGEGASISPDLWVDAYRPDLEEYLERDAAISLRTSRGCSGQCTFCATPALGAELSRWSPRPLSKVVGEVANLTKRVIGAGHAPIFNIVDDNFGSVSRIEDFVEQIKKNEIKIAFSLQMRISELINTEDLPKRMAHLHSSGLVRVFVGVESLNPSTLKSWRKLYDVDRGLEVIDAIKSSGILVHVGYLLWHHRQTVENARIEAQRLWEQGLFSVKCALSRLVLFSNTTQTQHCQRNSGIDIAEKPIWEPMESPSEQFYHKLSNYLDPLFQVWSEAATLLPTYACKQFLKSGGLLVEKIECIIEQCDVVAYRALVQDFWDTSVEELAAELLKELDEIRCTF